MQRNGWDIGDDVLLRNCQSIFYATDIVKQSAAIRCTDIFLSCL